VLGGEDHPSVDLGLGQPRQRPREVEDHLGGRVRDEHQVRVDAFGLGLAEFDLDLSWGLFHDPSPVPTQSTGREAEDARAERALRGPRKVGALEEAHNGTLYIDEVADMPLETQAKILRVLVEQRFQRLGGGPKVHVDVRVVSSTSHDLQKEMSAGRLREDLYHRLNVVPIKVPGLSDRREDVPELVRYFVQTISVASGLPQRRIGEDAMAVLQSHDWPGNVRQLRNNIERLMILVGGDPESIITADMLPEEIISPVPLSPNGAGGEHLMSLPLRDAREIFEREYLLAQVNRFGGNISRTAEFVGMERSALHRKLRALGVNSNERSPVLR